MGTKQDVLEDPDVELGAGMGVHIDESGKQPTTVVDEFDVHHGIERDPVTVDEHDALLTPWEDPAA